MASRICRERGKVQHGPDIGVDYDQDAGHGKGPVRSGTNPYLSSNYTWRGLLV